MKTLRKALLDMDVVGSMRVAMTAGPALLRDNIAGYNCSYLPIDSPRAFDELMFILMCGTGVGFSVEREYVNQLPEVSEELHDSDSIVVVADSKKGWASAFRELISLLYAGKVPRCDLTGIRPKGARLKTFGGRASGPEPLADLINYTVTLFRKAAGRRLTSLEVHDLCCKIADIVVVGGVRRSALISLSDLSDQRMQNAKNGAWPNTHAHRALANNSVAYKEKPDFEVFLGEMHSLFSSHSGERGIFSRPAAKNIAGRSGRRDTDHSFGTNPCSEIILRPNQFCNLSEVVCRPEDSCPDFEEKVRMATILGTLQSTLTNFRYLRKVWKNNTEEERLLGVSLTGIMDTDPFEDWELDVFKQVAIETNREYAELLGVPASTAITCVKPSGTVSQLTDSSSGIHPRYSDYYIRTVRSDKKDPLAQAMVDGGFPHETDVTNPSNWVFSFPIKAPEHSKTEKDMSALDQLEQWMLFQEHWCEHKPSMTCYYREDEFFDICSWVWKNFDKVSGISFLPLDDHVYQQAPYQPISEEEYEDWVTRMPVDFDWDIVEDEDNTEGGQTLACTNGVCEL